ncbi:hypothetical protein [Thioflexithrix psekupsensis]|nr:hypothetical protein [Thioflexithrix psekupsensis]
MGIKRLSPLAVAVSLALGSVGAVAQVDIDAPVAVNYASQLGSGVTLSSGTGCDVDVIGKLGTAIPANSTRYVRFGLTGGAGFGAALVAADLVIHTAGAVSTLVSGGAIGSNFVIFSVKTDATAAVATDTFALDVTSIKIGADKTPVQLNYSVHTNDVSASQGLDGTAIEKSLPNINYIGYAPGFSYGVTPSNLVGSVEKGFEVFNTSTNTNPSGSAGSLGKLSFAPALNVCNGAGNYISLADILQTTTTLEFQGDLSLIQDVDSDGNGLGTFGSTATGVSNGKVGFYTTAACTTEVALPPTAAVSSDGDKVTFSGTDVLGLDASFLCVIRPEDSKVKITPDDSYVLNLLPVSQSGYAASAVSAPTGDILRDGVVLEAPYFTMATGYISRFMLNHLTPSGTDAAFTIELRTDAGNTIVPKTDGPYPYDADTKTFSGVLPAGTLLQVNAADLVSSFTGKNRGSAVFTFVASNNDIQGIYQAVNTNTGELSNLVMARPGGGTGK